VRGRDGFTTKVPKGAKNIQQARPTRLNLEKAVETTDCSDDTDQQGLGLGSPPTCEVSARPGWKPPFQPRPSVESV